MKLCQYLILMSLFEFDPRSSVGMHIRYIRDFISMAVFSIHCRSIIAILEVKAMFIYGASGIDGDI